FIAETLILEDLAMSSVLIFSVSLFILSTTGLSTGKKSYSSNIFNGIKWIYFRSDSFLHVGDKQYYVSPVKRNFYSARDVCIQNNADLASVESDEEMNALSDFLFLKKYDNETIYASFWVSYFDEGRAPGSFYSVKTGRPMVYTAWSKPQPDNKNGIEHCVELWVYKDTYKMNDENCYIENRAVCE
ncbi:hypothetical protein KR074_004089, partial [Drosophila pseudoananassae]